MRQVLLTAVLLPTAALAADANQDGCDDDLAASLGACVHPSAIVDPSAILEVGAFVGAGASIGPDVQIAGGAAIAPRATLAGRVSGPSPQLVGESASVGRRASVGPDAAIGANASLARAVQAGARLDAGANAIVGYAATLGDDVTLGVGATVGNVAQIGGHVSLGDGAAVGRGTIVADADAEQPTAIDGRVGPDASIGAGVTISALARVSRGASVGEGATVDDGAVVGRGATVGAGAIVGAGARVRAGAEVCADTTLPTTEIVPRNGTWPAAGCVLQSCRAIFDAGLATGSHVYTIDPDGTGTGADPVDVWCDMSPSSGGWTLIGTACSATGTSGGGCAGSNTGFFITPGALPGDPWSSFAQHLTGLGATELRLTHYDLGQNELFSLTVAYAQDLFTVGERGGVAAEVLASNHPQATVGSTVFAYVNRTPSAPWYTGVGLSTVSASLTHGTLGVSSTYNLLHVGHWSDGTAFNRKNSGTSSGNAGQADSPYGRIWVR